MNFKKYLLKISSFVSLPLVSLASISCSNNQNVPPVDYEMVNKETNGLAFNSKGEITKFYNYGGSTDINLVIPEYLINNAKPLYPYYEYKQRITSIGNFVFSNNIINGIPSNPYAQYLKSIELPNSIKSIGGEAFYATPLTEIVIPDSVINIGDGAFENCKNLTNIILSKNLQYIGSSAFAGTSITNILFPETLLEIGFRAFSGTKLSGAIYIPDSVRLIDTFAFKGTQIIEVSLPANCKYYKSSFPQGCEINVR